MSRRPTELALAKQIGALVVAARAGADEFAAADRTGTRAIANGRGTAQGSEAWVAAQLVRSALEVARLRSAEALADIDRLMIAQSELAARDGTIGGLDELLAAQSEIEPIVARQTERIATLDR